jgi:hypothetical protein
MGVAGGSRFVLFTVSNCSRTEWLLLVVMDVAGIKVCWCCLLFVGVVYSLFALVGVLCWCSFTVSNCLRTEWLLLVVMDVAGGSRFVGVDRWYCSLLVFLVGVLFTVSNCLRTKW